MSSKKCIIRGCTTLCNADALTCTRCASPKPQYAVQFYGSIHRGPRDYKVVMHTLSGFPWTTCGTPAPDAVDCATLEEQMIDMTQLVEYMHTRWFWASHKLTDKMHWDTGAYVHELTPAHIETLRLKRELYFQEFDVSTTNMRRCVNDCVVNCKCHAWYGIVLTDKGSNIDTAISPVPDTPYTSCIDCYHLSGRNARGQFDQWKCSWDVESKAPLANSCCKACVDKPQRRRVWLDGLAGGHHLC